jgi:hypothetical protein
MTQRQRSRRPRRQQPDENLVAKLRLAEFKAKFPQEIEQICSLAPLRGRPHLLDDFLLTVDEIVGLAQRRLNKDQVERIVQSIRSSKDAADEIAAIMEALGKVDGVQLETVLSIASEVFPRPFFKNQDLPGFSRLLQDFRTLLLTLHAAIQFGTGITDKPISRGRPPSPYVRQALELIEAWENVTAEQFAEDSPLWLRKRVPTPKREKTDDGKIVIKQPSTEFIGIALRMIDPKIKDAQVFTAIKNALGLRDEFYEFARTRQPKSFVRKLQAFERFKTRRVADRKKSAPGDDLTN